MLKSFKIIKNYALFQLGCDILPMVRLQGILKQRYTCQTGIVFSVLIQGQITVFPAGQKVIRADLINLPAKEEAVRNRLHLPAAVMKLKAYRIGHCGYRMNGLPVVSAAGVDGMESQPVGTFFRGRLLYGREAGMFLGGRLIAPAGPAAGIGTADDSQTSQKHNGAA